MRQHPDRPDRTDRLDFADRPDLADLADARGVSVDDLVDEAVRRYVDLETTRVTHAAMRLALRHHGLLKRLGT
ncbi:hypothetical protein [Streptomyces sp. NPDC051909]|uniref:hypothetical protein n=1 Tax=Streptomyces sp. NPDC051909 TaxID=3154944 RepID=UPI003432802D